MKKYTDKDIEDWTSYERVRLCGLYNMFDPRARDMVGLTKERYIFILENYSDIREQINEQRSVK